MPPLTQQGRQIVTDQATRHNVSEDTVTQLLDALRRGGGRRAQFNLYELGGMGQWLKGGMVMIGDMFNDGLKSQVDTLCSDLADALSSTKVFSQDGAQASNPWPADLVHPTAQGSQNDMRYAYFPGQQRLAVTQNGQTSLYDTAGHDIGGFGQSQGNGQSLTFTSQHGTVPLSHLPEVAQPAQAPDHPDSAPASEDQIFALIRHLSELHDQGILTEDEFSAKKAELLSRL